MKKHLFLSVVASIVLTFSIKAQISEGGSPISFNKYNLQADIPVKIIPAINVQALLAEDEQNIGKAVPFRFGKDIDVYYNLMNSGIWETMDNGDRLWRLKIESPNAYSLNFICNQFFIPDGARLFVYSGDKSIVRGAYTSKNNNAQFSFANAPIASSSIVLEYFEPANVIGQGRININKVIHGYRDTFAKNRGPFGTSGSCNINVNCPLGDDWQNEKTGVAIIVTSNNSAVCTGTIVNNTAEDAKPYFLTANHCTQSANTQNWIFIFNHESEECIGTTGPVDQSINGAELVATDSPSDFALLLLNNDIPAEYNVFFCGWSNADIPADSTICMHHPAGDLKKISKDIHPSVSSSYGNTPNTHWEVSNWEFGTTEGGSSGSALFNFDGHIVGQLHGGQASCTNNSYDRYGKIAYSWTNNNNESANKRLKDWLDPTNSGVVTLDGKYFNTPEFDMDMALTSVTSPKDYNCNNVINPVVKIRNNGATPVTSVKIYYQINDYLQVHEWTGNLAFSSSATVSLSGVQLEAGNHEFKAFLSSPNNGIDQNLSNDTIEFPFVTEIGAPLKISVLTDNKPTETTWELKKEDGTIIYSNPTLEAQTTYTENLCLDNGCYDFIIYDSGNNGLNGLFGFLYVGEFSLTLNGEQIAQSPSGSNFGAKDSTRFCITDVSVDNILSSNNLFLYPNPANDYIYVEMIGKNQQSIASVYDIRGSLVQKEMVLSEKSNRINIASYQAGVYVLVVNTGDGIIRKQFIKMK
ncbi:MAG: T9SS type A sorting domain-containing protein [Bacteroidales bacterium]|nr:T9SS type A sorting domain-containing protein [Bacteroidales bacterium]